jgi:hypothetical protein
MVTSLGAFDDLPAAQLVGYRDPAISDIGPAQRQRLARPATGHLHQADQEGVAQPGQGLVWTDSLGSSE